MNTALFRSWHALGAALIALAFVLWSLTAGAAHPNRHFLLWSGWTSLALFLVVVLYVLRKYVHKLGISPEFKMRVPVSKLERAELRLGELRAKIEGQQLTDARRILALAKTILREEGVQRVVKVRLEQTENPGYILRAVPTGPLGQMGHWLHAHLYYGLAAGVLVALHGGLSFGSPMALLLNGLSLVVILSGVVGIALWSVGPGWLTRAESDLSIEKAHALVESLDRKIEAGFEAVEPASRPLFADVDKAREDFAQRSAAALRSYREHSPRDKSAEDLMALIGQRRGVRDELRSLTRIKHTMNFWRTAHIPGALILTVVVMIHVISVSWY